MSEKSKKPVFILIAAISLDGKITAGSKKGSEWTSKEDRKWFQAELDRSDAVIMGRKTFDAIPRPLTVRNRIVFSHKKTFQHSGECPNIFSGGKSDLLRLIVSKKWKRCAVVGGTSVYQWFLERNLINEMSLTVEPVIFGSGKLLTENSILTKLNFTLQSVKNLNAKGTLLVHYKSND